MDFFGFFLSQTYWGYYLYTKVTTEHQKWPKTGQNSIISSLFLPELELGPHSERYVLVLWNNKISLLNICPTRTTSSSSTTIKSIISSTNRRSTALHRHIYSRLWLVQITRVATGTEAESICVFRMFLSFRVQQNIVSLVTTSKPNLWQNSKSWNVLSLGTQIVTKKK